MKIVNKLKIFNLLVSLIFWLIFDSLEQGQIKNAALRNLFGKQLCQKIYILNAKYILNVFFVFNVAYYWFPYNLSESKPVHAGQKISW